MSKAVTYEQRKKLKDGSHKMVTVTRPKKYENGGRKNVYVDLDAWELAWDKIQNKKTPYSGISELVVACIEKFNEEH